MALAGRGVLAIWNDIAPGGDAEFDHWQTSEHIPERVGVPGFLRGRRYTALIGSPRTSPSTRRSPWPRSRATATWPDSTRRRRGRPSASSSSATIAAPRAGPPLSLGVGTGRSDRDARARPPRRQGRHAARLADGYRVARRRESARDRGRAPLRGRRGDDGRADGGEEAAREAGYPRPLGGAWWKGSPRRSSKARAGPCSTPSTSPVTAPRPISRWPSIASSTRSRARAVLPVRSNEGGPAAMPLRRLLVGVPDGEHRRLVEGPAHELGADGKPGLGEARTAAPAPAGRARSTGA